MRSLWFSLFTLVLVTLLAACGTLEMSVERTPTPDHAATATLSALATENARLAAQVAMQATPTPTASLGKLAYVQGGDIWVRQLPDGEPVRLTQDGRNSAPRWSPSGKWLLFRKEHQIWAMCASGTDAHVLNDGATVDEDRWSPVEDRVAYTAGVGSLYLVNADGSGEKELVPQRFGAPVGSGVGRIAWSPDGTEVAYEWTEAEAEKPPSYQGLRRTRADGGEPVEIYANPDPLANQSLLAGWSADERHILFWRGLEMSASLKADGLRLMAIPAGGGEPVDLLADAMLVYDDFIAPAPQGDKIAVTVGGGRESWTHKRIALVEAGDGELACLTGEDVAALSPSWSPDGQQIAYIAAPDAGLVAGGEPAKEGVGKRRIWTTSTDGSNPRQLTNDPKYRDERPLWSADGSHILFARMEDDRASLWLMRADSSEQRQVAEELTPSPGWFGYYGHIDWDELFDWWRGLARAPEGMVVPTPGPAPTPTTMRQPTYPGLALIYHLDSTLYRGDFLGAEAVRLGPLTPDALWSAPISGRFLACAIGPRVMLMDLENGEARILHTVERPNARVGSPVWSTDGKALAYVATYDDPQAPFHRAVEVGVVGVQGGEGRVVTLLTEGPVGATLLGYDRASGKVWLIPRGQDTAISEVHVYDVEQPGASPRIIAVSGCGDAAASPDLSRLAVMDCDRTGQALTKVYNLLEPTAPPVVLRHPKGTLGTHYLWSQGHLAYVVLAGFLHWGETPSEAAGIWVWEPGSGEPCPVAPVVETTDRDDTPIAWTPDGDWLLVRQTPLGESPRYAVVSVERGEPVPLSAPSEARVLGWAQGLAAPSPAPSPPTPTSTAILTATCTYTDTAIGFAIDYPADWDADGVRGGFVWLSNPATSGEERQAINIAALAEENLEAMLENVERGSFGPYMISSEPVQLGGLETLKVTFRRAPESLSLL